MNVYRILDSTGMDPTQQWQFFLSVPSPLHYVGPCHHDMVCPWIADGGDSLQIWKVAANTLN